MYYPHRLKLVLSFIGLGLAGITLPARAGAETGQSAPKRGTNWRKRITVDAGCESERS